MRCGGRSGKLREQREPRWGGALPRTEQGVASGAVGVRLESMPAQEALVHSIGL